MLKFQNSPHIQRHTSVYGPNWIIFHCFSDKIHSITTFFKIHKHFCHSFYIYINNIFAGYFLYANTLLSKLCNWLKALHQVLKEWLAALQVWSVWIFVLRVLKIYTLLVKIVPKRIKKTVIRLLDLKWKNNRDILFLNFLVVKCLWKKPVHNLSNTITYFGIYF